MKVRFDLNHHDFPFDSSIDDVGLTPVLLWDMGLWVNLVCRHRSVTERLTAGQLPRPIDNLFR
jgi:hypothetical protein